MFVKLNLVLILHLVKLLLALRLNCEILVLGIFKLFLGLRLEREILALQGGQLSFQIFPLILVCAQLAYLKQVLLFVLTKIAEPLLENHELSFQFLVFEGFVVHLLQLQNIALFLGYQLSELTLQLVDSGLECLCLGSCPLGLLKVKSLLLVFLSV